MSANFSIDSSQFDSLQRNIERLPNVAETIINEDLKSKIAPVMKKSVLGLIPISNRKKAHAKLYKSIKDDTKENLTLTLKPKPKYRYLVFPDLGVGTSKKKMPQKFMERGVEQKVNYSIEELNKSLIEQINKTLGGQ
ncbi:TPA: hypothetical protein QCU24_002217 [Bacillus cereus]|uniref:HK97 gp10 family phage protein n=1 Tax=Bacillus thuringiensis serovar subtoxicus TaxID=475791 RepID=A0A9X6FE54_BACTU|nr:hypothetical protein [Bacillus thuringiensis]MEB4839401.1 hypothetical protein [Paenibacillus jamilae]MEB8582991.1 hypothetical protein [Bacillus cereus]MCR6855442.1 hypothetical protein [Bacillus thuringiensis]MDR4282426.1 hypothetical protein [Bacillus thuringiensis]MEB8592777.1 hypothetical protein [Bacillus cereus]